MDYYAEQSCTAGRNAFFTGMHPLRTGMIRRNSPAARPSCGRRAGARPVSARPGLHHRQFGKNHLGDHPEALPTAHGFQEYWGYLYHLDAMQGVSFPDINKSPTRADHCTALQERADPRCAGGSRRPGPQDLDVPDAPASSARLQILRRHAEEPGPAKTRAR